MCCKYFPQTVICLMTFLPQLFGWLIAISPAQALILGGQLPPLFCYLYVPKPVSSSIKNESLVLDGLQGTFTSESPWFCFLFLHFGWLFRLPPLPSASLSLGSMVSHVVGKWGVNVVLPAKCLERLCPPASQLICMWSFTISNISVFSVPADFLRSLLPLLWT